MVSRDSFVDFVRDQLGKLGEVRVRPMFGGHGLYCAELFFGIIDEGRLYFKTAEATRSPYIDAGMKPFQPTPKQILKNYYEVPVDVIENDDELVAWARVAVRTGQASAKPARQGSDSQAH